MWRMMIRVKRNDELHGKRLESLLLDFLSRAGIIGATVWSGIDGFGKRGRSNIRIEGMAFNYPVVIEVIDQQSKLEPLLPQIRRMVGDNGLVSIEEVLVF